MLYISVNSQYLTSLKLCTYYIFLGFFSNLLVTYLLCMFIFLALEKHRMGKRDWIELVCWKIYDCIHTHTPTLLIRKGRNRVLQMKWNGKNPKRMVADMLLAKKFFFCRNVFSPLSLLKNQVKTSINSSQKAFLSLLSLVKFKLGHRIKLYKTN